MNQVLVTAGKRQENASSFQVLSFPCVGKLKNQQNKCKTHSSFSVKDKAMKSVKEELQEHSVINSSLDTL